MEREWGWGAVDDRAEGLEGGWERAYGPAVVRGECGGDGPSFSSSKAGWLVEGEATRPRCCALTLNSEGHRTLVSDGCHSQAGDQSVLTFLAMLDLMESLLRW